MNWTGGQYYFFGDIDLILFLFNNEVDACCNLLSAGVLREPDLRSLQTIKYVDIHILSNRPPKTSDAARTLSTHPSS